MYSVMECRDFTTAFIIFKCYKVSRHTLKCHFDYTHNESTAFRKQIFTKPINAHYHYVHISFIEF
jgi:hypothetical protein